jgi:hypothetical protein
MRLRGYDNQSAAKRIRTIYSEMTMGLTIHYEGYIKNASVYDELILICRAFADSEDWPTQMINESYRSMERVIDEEGVPYEGPTQGIRLYPHPDCEPLTLEFGSDLFCQDWTKTQFAGPGIHRKVVTLLTNLKDLFVDLKVSDESNYWTNRDDLALEERFLRSDRAIDEVFREYPEGQYKVKTPDGRFIDIIT